MTEQERTQQREWIIASLMLGPTRADRHGVYARRRKPVSLVLPAVVPPTVVERRPL